LEDIRRLKRGEHVEDAVDHDGSFGGSQLLRAAVSGGVEIAYRKFDPLASSGFADQSDPHRGDVLA
jgi:hypothetical protein